ncbi:MAG: hypothetical protein QM811_10960 [Pirellulales bacterium]
MSQNAQSNLKSYTIPLRNNNALSRPLEALRANPGLMEKQGLAPTEGQAPAIDGAGQINAAALQTQQAMLMQQAMAQQQAALMQQQTAVMQTAANATMYQAGNASSGDTPLSGRSGSNFQRRQIRPMYNSDQAAAAGADGVAGRGISSGIDRRFSTFETPGSRRHNLPAKSRACSLGTVPLRIAVRPSMLTTMLVGIAPSRGGLLNIVARRSGSAHRLPWRWSE